MLLNREQLMLKIQDPAFRQSIYMTSFLQVEGKAVPTTMPLTDKFLGDFIEMVCNYYAKKGVQWTKVLFSVTMHGNMMFLDVNAPTVVH